MKKLKLISFIFLFGLFACEENITPEPKYNGAKMTINNQYMEIPQSVISYSYYNLVGGKKFHFMIPIAGGANLDFSSNFHNTNSTPDVFSITDILLVANLNFLETTGLVPVNFDTDYYMSSESGTVTINIIEANEFDCEFDIHQVHNLNSNPLITFNLDITEAKLYLNYN